MIGWDENPFMHSEITRQSYFDVGHAAARLGAMRVPAFEDSFMSRMKLARRVEVVAPTFLCFQLVVGTRRVATVTRRLAEQMAQSEAIVVRELPFVMPPTREMLQWHVASGNDPALNWLVERIRLMASRDPAKAHLAASSPGTHRVGLISRKLQHGPVRRRTTPLTYFESIYKLTFIDVISAPKWYQPGAS
jgi:hypothetical protein